MPDPAGWVRVAGDGLVAEGPAVVTHILWRCDKNDEECHIYDGVDAISGKIFTKLIGDANKFYDFPFPSGVTFANGIYVDQTTVNDEITVCFRQPG